MKEPTRTPAQREFHRTALAQSPPAAECTAHPVTALYAKQRAPAPSALLNTETEQRKRAARPRHAKMLAILCHRDTPRQTTITPIDNHIAYF
eukprot:COSAG06_NODE_43647_length_370_cov_0.723247_1_plen_91_part_01